MLTGSYRKRLEADLIRWVHEGWLTADGAGAIRRDVAREHAGFRLPALLGLFGGLLIASSVAAFVAANWEAIPRLVKLAMILTAIAVAFLVASAYAGIAGVLWAAQAGVVQPQMGFTPLLKAFVAAIIGGFGSIAGALLGGYVLGALEIFIVAFLPSSVSSYRDAIVFSILIAFLLVRPGGLLKPNREIKL